MNNNTTKQEIIFAAEGGGLGGGFVAGALDALNKEITDFSTERFTEFRVSSSSMPTMLYTLSDPTAEGMSANIKKIWRHDMSDPKFVTVSNLFRKGPVIDIDYMVDHIFRENNPLDLEQIVASKTRLLFPAFETKTSQIEIFQIGGDPLEKFESYAVRQVGRGDIYTAIKIATAIPFFYNRHISAPELGGYYMDGAISMPFPFKRDEVDKMIVVLTDERGTWWHIFTHAVIALVGLIAYLFLNKNIPIRMYFEYMKRGFWYKKARRDLRTLEKQGNVLVVEPSRALGSNSDNSAETLEENYQLGYNEIRKRKAEIAQFVQN